MPRDAAPPSPDLLAAARARPLAAMALAVALLTALRLALLAASGLDLFVDEAQYWFWSTALDAGYFSKPPLIAWVIRAFTELGGADTAFWIRAAGPLFHAAAALLVGHAAARLTRDGTLGALAGFAYATLPAVSFGSMVISTDTVMMPFLAAALLLWAGLIERPSPRRAALMGACVGLGLLAKYAMVYFALCALLAALARADLRLSRRDAAVAAAAALLAVSPNIVWNVLQGGVTATHTLHNAGAAQGFPRFDSLGEYVGAQFGVMGLLFAGWLWAAAVPARPAALRAPEAARARGEAALWWFSVPVIAIVCAQALRSEANPNWGVAACVAATPLAVMLLHARAPRLLTAALAVNLAAAVALPLAAAFPEALTRPSGRYVLSRAMGQDAAAASIAERARAEAAQAVLVDSRALLAALTHHLRDDPLAVYAPRPDGPPGNSYELRAALPDAGSGPERLLVVSPDGPPPAPAGYRAGGAPVSWTPDAPFLKGRALTATLFLRD